jgi:ABC-2 type transport system permease protein
MKTTLAIAWKEIRTYFTTPMAYIVAMVFLALTGYYFINDMLGSVLPEASIRGFLIPSTAILVLLAPLLTMRLLAEEQKMGTMELLLTAPIRDWQIVVGKYLATFVFFLGTLAFTLYYLVLVAWFGTPDMGPVLTGYIGLILYGGATLAIGLFASSLSPNQIVSAVLGFGILLLLTIIQYATRYISGTAATIVNQMSMQARFEDFARGILDLSSVIYYITVMVVFLFLTIRSVESHRWR